MKALVEQKAIPLIILMGILLFGCSTTRKPDLELSTNHLPPSFKNLENNYWWTCDFRVAWPDDGGVDWGMDLLLAHAVVSPVLVEHINNISYWRFHRRAARDASGHQFSFIFYSTPETAAVVLAEIANSKRLREAYEANLVKTVLIDDPELPLLPNVEDTSDRNWSPVLQKNWPAFIMGASSLWLGLIDDYMQDAPGNVTDIHRLLTSYREVNNKITETWSVEGQHALLHHLNAMFGYAPLRIRKNLSF